MEYRVAFLVVLTYLCVLVKDNTTQAKKQWGNNLPNTTVLNHSARNRRCIQARGVGVDVASFTVGAQHRLGSSQNETPDWYSHLSIPSKGGEVGARVYSSANRCASCHHMWPATGAARPTQLLKKHAATPRSCFVRLVEIDRFLRPPARHPSPQGIFFSSSFFDANCRFV